MLGASGTGATAGTGGTGGSAGTGGTGGGGALTAAARVLGRTGADIEALARVGVAAISVGTAAVVAERRRGDDEAVEADGGVADVAPLPEQPVTPPDDQGDR